MYEFEMLETNYKWIEDAKEKIGFYGGVHFDGGDYYCIYTGDDLTFDRYDIEVHEQCHALVEDDYKHFCGVKP